MAIISMAQQARPNVTGQIEDRRAHCTPFSTVVVSTGISRCSDIISVVSHSRQSHPSTGWSAAFVAPIEHTLAPDVHVAGEQNGEEDQQLEEAGPAEAAERHRKRK